MFSLWWSINSKISSDDKVIAIQDRRKASIDPFEVWRNVLMWLVLGGASLSIILATESKRTEFILNHGVVFIHKTWRLAHLQLKLSLALYDAELGPPTTINPFSNPSTRT
eukprot:754157_1